MENMDIWNKVKTPPDDALKKITGGRLSGMTDIKPQWRYQTLTEIFGPCGLGWYYEIDKRWLEEGSESQIVAFVEINLFVKFEGVAPEDEWSKPIPGTGGSMLVVNEKAGPHTSDEAYKMATTDALSVAAKMIGVGADVYSGNTGGSKYGNQTSKNPSQTPGKKEPQSSSSTKDKKPLSDGQNKRFFAICKNEHSLSNDEVDEFREWLKEHDDIEIMEGKTPTGKIRTVFTGQGISTVFDKFDDYLGDWIDKKKAE